MVEGTGKRSEAFRKILLEGATSQYLDNETVEVEKTKMEKKVPIAMTQALTPQDEEFTAATAELCHGGSRKLHTSIQPGGTSSCKSRARNLELSPVWSWSSVG